MNGKRKYEIHADFHPADQSDKVYINNNENSTVIELPEYGEVRLIVKAGKVVKYDTIHSHKVHEKA